MGYNDSRADLVVGIVLAVIITAWLFVYAAQAT